MSKTGSTAVTWRQIALHPLLWAAVCAIGAAALAPTRELDFPVFMLTLVSGFLCAHWLVGLTQRIASTRIAFIVHAALAVGAGVLLPLLVEVLPDLVPRGWPRAVLAAVSLGAVPAAGWIWVTFLSRVTWSIRAREKRLVRTPLAWDHGSGRATLRFGGVPMSLRALGVRIAVAVAVGAAVTVAVLIALGDRATHLGPTLAVVLFGALIALPLYRALTALLGRRSLPCSLELDSDRIRLQVGAERREYSFREIVLLRWRRQSDYARVDIQDSRGTMTLLVGLARQAPGIAGELPPLPCRAVDALVGSGLVATRTRRGADEYRRIVAADPPSTPRPRRADSPRADRGASDARRAQDTIR